MLTSRACSPKQKYVIVYCKNYNYKLLKAYQILDESLMYCPNPINGGAAKINAIVQIVQILREPQNECFVGECHER